jgi:hypothetical protein
MSNQAATARLESQNAVRFKHATPLGFASNKGAMR